MCEQSLRQTLPFAWFIASQQNLVVWGLGLGLGLGMRPSLYPKASQARMRNYAWHENRLKSHYPGLADHPTQTGNQKISHVKPTHTHWRVLRISPDEGFGLISHSCRRRIAKGRAEGPVPVFERSVARTENNNSVGLKDSIDESSKCLYSSSYTSSRLIAMLCSW